MQQGLALTRDIFDGTHLFSEMTCAWSQVISHVTLKVQANMGCVMYAFIIFEVTRACHRYELCNV